MIYIIESGDYFKVGYTAKDFQTQRSKAYNTHNPDWKLVEILEGDSMLEVFLHKKLKPYRHRGEWFTKFDGWYNFIIDIVENSTDADFQSYNPYGREKYNDKDIPNVFKMGLNNAEMKFWLYIMCYYGYNNNSGKLPNNIELNPNYLGKTLFKNRHEAMKGILKLQSLDLIRKYGKKKDLYSASPRHINPNVYMFPDAYAQENNKG